jgi:hypothetical protein
MQMQVPQFQNRQSILAKGTDPLAGFWQSQGFFH